MTDVITLSPQDLYVIKRAQLRMDTKNLPCSAWVRSIVTNVERINTSEARATLGVAFMPYATELNFVNAEVPPPPPVEQTPVKQVSEVFVPILPEYARLTDAQLSVASHAGQWLTDFVGWAKQRSPMTPPFFFEGGGLMLATIAIARRVVLQLHDKIYPHLYMVWIAETTRFAKSTGLKAVVQVLDETMPHMRMPEGSSPEALFRLMSGKLPENLGDLEKHDRELEEMGNKFAAQRVLLVDEFSRIWGASKKDYMAGFEETVMALYDANERMTENRQKGGISIINRPGMSILGSTTPVAMARNITFDKWLNGDLARYALLYTNTSLPYVPFASEFNPPHAVTAPIRQLHNMLPKPGEGDAAIPPISAFIDQDALEAWQNYARAFRDEKLTDQVDERLASGNYGRLPVMLLKVALILACLDWINQAEGNKPRIRMSHYARAFLIVESWRASLHHLLPALDESADSRYQRKLETILSHSPTGLTLRELAKRTGIATKHLQSAMDVLIESGIVEVIDHKASTGPSTRIYKKVSTESAGSR